MTMYRLAYDQTAQAWHLETAKPLQSYVVVASNERLLPMGDSDAKSWANTVFRSQGERPLYWAAGNDGSGHGRWYAETEPVSG